MLVVTRKEGEAIRIGENIIVMVSLIENGSVRLGVEAPREIAIERVAKPEILAVQSTSQL
ncbi:carbon storage regulator [Ferrimicrobium sp.]|uniref:carbon storage regulator n=1 Tax=Ferrimicrobium sp. TaxID=2926050 RepID=UPI002618C68E|nr:carbon storage regulator [Ferrimicrobium sp.]